MRAILDPTRRFMLGLYLTLLNVFDVYITWYVLSIGGTEANPVVKDWIHTPWILVVKMALCLYIWYTCCAETRHPRQATLALWIAVIYYLYIALHNINVVF